MKKFRNYILLSFLGGVAISIGGTLLLSVDSPVLGAFLFSTGLFAICVMGFYLYTGQAGYIFDNKPSYSAWLCVTWLGNFLGTLAVSSVLKCTRISVIADKAAAMTEVKLSDSLLSLFILAVFCGMLVFLAVDIFRNGKYEIARFMAIVMCVMTFILCGFEHCIADMFYFSMAGVWNRPEAWAAILIISLGNLLGCFLIPVIKKAAKN